MRVGDEQDPEPSERHRANPPDDTTLVSPPACIVIVIVMWALFLGLPHL